MLNSSGAKCKTLRLINMDQILYIFELRFRNINHFYKKYKRYELILKKYVWKQFSINAKWTKGIFVELKITGEK